MYIFEDKKVKKVFENYPPLVCEKLLFMRELIFEVVSQEDTITQVVETLKWGEPSYLTKHGSTIRMDWKSKSPNQFALYFKCTSRLVPTFKSMFDSTFNFDGNRGIVFKLNEKVPDSELKHCIKAALIYHKVKYLPKLGIQNEDHPKPENTR